MRDPLDRLLQILGDNLVCLVAIIAVCAVLWIGGGLK